jgi:ProP effector
MDNPAAPQPPAANPARGLLKLLQESFPAIRDSQPLAIGIDAAILARLPEVDKKTLRAALRMHTGATRYLKAMTRATQRVGLDGEPAGEVTDEQRQHATDKLKERFRKEADAKRAEAAKAAEEAAAQAAARERAEKLAALAAKFSRKA